MSSHGLSTTTLGSAPLNTITARQNNGVRERKGHTIAAFRIEEPRLVEETIRLFLQR